MKKRRSRVKGDRKKKVAYEFIDPESVAGHPIYQRLRKLVTEYHPELEDARIALAWNTNWRPDVDGRLAIGKCKRASDLDRELVQWDFIILLLRAWWQDKDTTEAMRDALLDHELSHAAVKLDDRTGKVVIDERDRKVYRMRKHDLEEFTAVVARHGIYKRDIEHFAQALLQKRAEEAFGPCPECEDSPGWIAKVVDSVPRATRCSCWLAWSERRRDAREAKAS